MHFTTGGDSPELLKPLLESFQAARTAMKKEMEKAIASIYVNYMTYEFLPCTVFRIPICSKFSFDSDNHLFCYVLLVFVGSRASSDSLTGPSA